MTTLTRRSFVAGSLSLALPLPSWSAARGDSIARNRWQLAIGETDITLSGQRGRAQGVNGTVPGPLVRLKEGERVRLSVSNALREETSIHWHGMLLPYEMDGVPGLGFDGIRPGETFEYEFDVRQNGTYWYHSHSGLQEQTGVYGPLIVDAAGPEPYNYDAEHVVLLSDWTFEDPWRIFRNLKMSDDYYNINRLAANNLDIAGENQTARQALADRMAWAQMRMTMTDIADVTGRTYTYLMNGRDAEGNWTGLFEPGQTVRLRFINGSAMSFFNVRIPGAEMTVIAADGQFVDPVGIDEFQIGTAETYDVLLTLDDRAYTVMAEAMDRSGYVRGTLAPRPGMTADVPELRRPPVLGMQDMGMNHAGHDGHGMASMQQHADDAHAGHGGMPHDSDGGDAGMQNRSDEHAGHGMHGDMTHDTQEPSAHTGMDHSMHMASMPDDRDTQSLAFLNDDPIRHDHPSGAGVANLNEAPFSRLDHPGIGLEDVPHRTLTYASLRSATKNDDLRKPGRTIELHLTGNMHRYMWSFDGQKFSEVKDPIRFRYGERLRMILVNDTMMAHPIHLHGMFFEIVNGHGAYQPRKNVVTLKPAERLAVDITADEPGLWAFHCHLLYHMKAGMMRVVQVSEQEDA